MDDLKLLRSLNRQAILWDFVCIIIAAAVLYATNAQLLPFWALVAGALLALLTLVTAMVKLRAARRLARKIADSTPVITDHSDHSENTQLP